MKLIIVLEFHKAGHDATMLRKQHWNAQTTLTMCTMTDIEYKAIDNL